MPQQDQFIQSHGQNIPQYVKDRLLFSNKEIPGFLRLLIPAIKTVEHYRELLHDPKWINQEVHLTKESYQLLTKKIVFLAKQSERLDEV